MGEKCKIAGQNEFLKPSEECEMSKGLHCQQYQQGNLCGCVIKSSLSWDEHAGECRRKPGQHCPYVNVTANPGAYERLSYNHKCHARADCVQVAPIPEAKLHKNKNSKTEQVSLCRCKPGYKESRDGLVCHSVSKAHNIPSATIMTFLVFITVRCL
ncbi:hypothetical protein Ocin01_18305 [Orchesella cincta]|uniref:Uncharacterized protein n=1 Tax=Orchesella cincta TaxID=48709 RepID=A0A1D2M5X7_ORCCI|nr:hypothetical protein Ocin01_18305 [Orchesella cincta]